MRKKTYGVFLIMALLFPTVVAPRVPSTTTIPPISAQSAGVFFQCQPFLAFPGSVVIGMSGFILIECPNGGALTLDGTLTPSFQLGIGYVQAAIILHGSSNRNPCNYDFRPLTVGNTTVLSGSFLNRTLTFSSNPVSGNMLTAVYDYCLQYQNAPSTGLNGFSIIWT
jgi:hypothetical protein